MVEPIFSHEELNTAVLTPGVKSRLVKVWVEIATLDRGPLDVIRMAFSVSGRNFKGRVTVMGASAAFVGTFLSQVNALPTLCHLFQGGSADRVRVHGEEMLGIRAAKGCSM